MSAKGNKTSLMCALLRKKSIRYLYLFVILIGQQWSGLIKKNKCFPYGCQMGIAKIVAHRAVYLNACEPIC